MTQPIALYLADILEDAGKPADVAEKAARFYRGTYTVSRFKEDDGTWAVDLGVGGCEEQT